ncbi:bile acid-CoA:amino acid N-acyltransferase-like [Amphiura filiformis]|uniref:bile acid-CoA:amino acid N-acyltransferase-like n=1 Tax=Amphiura filiformis TaxID=82378 RepID=UPI003B21C9A8
MASAHSPSTTSRPEVSIAASPRNTLMYERVTIEVKGLMPGEAITLRTYFHDEGKKFESHAHYRSDVNGKVNTSKQGSEGGQYTGVEPMGLFWSMTACPNHKYGTRYMKNDVTKPLLVNITVHCGHLDSSQCRHDVNPIATTSVERWYMNTNVERFEVRAGRVRGTLLKPKGPGPFPAVIDMFGGVRPGCNEIRAAPLATKGYVAFALAYFGGEGQPPKLEDTKCLEMEYFEEATDWLSRQPYVQAGGIGTIGICKGGEMALAMAIHFPEKIRATIAFSTAGIFNVCPTSYKGEFFPHAEYDLHHDNYQQMATIMNQISFAPDGALITRDISPDTKLLERYQKFEKIQCPALIICGDHDGSVNWTNNGRIIAEKIQTNGHNNDCELVVYPGGGHLIEPPQAPLCITSYQPPWGLIHWGGIPAQHAHVQDEAWTKMLAFLEHNLRCDSQSIPASKL